MDEKPSATVDEINGADGTVNEKHLDHTGATFDDLDPNNTRAAKADDSDGKTEWSYRKFLAALSLSGLYVSGSIPTLLVGASLQYIAPDLDAKFVSWLITANTLAVAAITPFVGSLSDIFGPRYILLSAAVFLMVGVVIFGTAHSFAQAVSGMTLTGVGCGVCELTTISGIAELAPVRLRSLYLAFLTFSMMTFTPYPFYTQWLCREANWRWVLWMILIWTGFWWILCVLTYFPKRVNYRIKNLSKLAILKRLDWIGAATSSAGVIMILISLQDGGYRYPWKDAHIIAPLIVGFMTLVAFVIWEGWFAAHPMVPKPLLKERGVVVPLTVAFIAGFAYYSVLSYYPSLLQTFYYTKSPIEIGVLSIGFSLGLLCGSSFVNAALAYVRGNVRWPLLFSCAMMTAFTGALMKATPDNSAYPATIAYFAAFGIGGSLVPPATVALTCCPDSLIATASGLAMCVRTLGGAIGTSVYSAIYQNKVAEFLPKEIAKFAIAAGLPPDSAAAFVTEFLGNAGNVSSIPNVTPEIISQAALGQAWGYRESFKDVWAASVAFGCVACIACFFIPNTTKYLTNRVAVEYDDGVRGDNSKGA